MAVRICEFRRPPRTIRPHLRIPETTANSSPNAPIIRVVVLCCSVDIVASLSACTADTPTSAKRSDDEEKLVTVLCDARETAHESHSAVETIFMDRAHGTVHEPAQSTAEINRVIAARLLEAKQAVEADLEAGRSGTPSPPTSMCSSTPLVVHWRSPRIPLQGVHAGIAMAKCRRIVAALVVFAVGVAACSQQRGAPAASPERALHAEAASYDLAAGEKTPSRSGCSPAISYSPGWPI